MEFVELRFAVILFLLFGTTSALLPSRTAGAAEAIDTAGGSQWGGTSARNSAERARTCLSNGTSARSTRRRASGPKGPK